MAELFLAEFAPRRLAEILRPAVSLLAAIPSVVYGFVAMNLLLPLLQVPTGGVGMSLLAGAVVLAVMILPALIGVSEDSLRAVPRDYKEASLGLGASHWQTCWRVLLPAARSGILASVILSAGRAIGETMAVMMVTGNMFMAPRLQRAVLPGGQSPLPRPGRGTGLGLAIVRHLVEGLREPGLGGECTRRRFSLHRATGVIGFTIRRRAPNQSPPGMIDLLPLLRIR